MKIILRIFSSVHALMALLFVCAAIVLIVIAARIGWTVFGAGLDRAAAQAVIEAVGLLAAAVVALQIAQTITEEEVIRDAHISGPTRVRRFLSRFLVVIVVALSIEGLVATFKALHEDPAQLPYAGWLRRAQSKPDRHHEQAGRITNSRCDASFSRGVESRRSERPCRNLRSIRHGHDQERSASND